MSLESEPLAVLREQLLLPQDYVAPRTETEVMLEQIWRTALSMDCVGVFDSYQDLGGDSFLATVIFSMIETSFGMQIPMSILVNSPTIAEFSAKIDQLKQSDGAA
jgi:hypothetical protein